MPSGSKNDPIDVDEVMEVRVRFTCCVHLTHCVHLEIPVVLEQEQIGPVDSAEEEHAQRC